MSDAAIQSALHGLEGNLRAFVSRRVREVEVDDVLQDVFVRLQRGVGALQDEHRLEAWVYRVARSAIVDQYRARQRHPLTADPDVPEQTVEADEASEAEQELARCIPGFVRALPEPYREALTLTELQGLTQKEAAERLGVSLSGMKSRVQRGREKLREAFDACCHIALDARGRAMECVPRQAVPSKDGC